MSRANLDLDQFDFDDDRVKDFDTPTLKQLLRDVWDILCEHRRVGQPDLLEQTDLDGYDWEGHYIQTRILPRLRRLLVDAGLIAVETEPAERGPFDRTVWVLQDTQP